MANEKRTGETEATRAFGDSREIAREKLIRANNRANSVAASYHFSMSDDRSALLAELVQARTELAEASEALSAFDSLAA